MHALGFSKVREAFPESEKARLKKKSEWRERRANGSKKRESTGEAPPAGFPSGDRGPGDRGTERPAPTLLHCPNPSPQALPT